MPRILHVSVVVAVVLVSAVAGIALHLAEQPAGESPSEIDRAFGRSMPADPVSAARHRFPLRLRVNEEPSSWQEPEGPQDRFAPGEVLAMRTPGAFITAAADLGYSVVETLSLPRLGERVHRIRLPPGIDVPAGVAKLRQRFPRAVVDANHYFRLAQGMDLPASVARASIGWDRLPIDCGKGVRIGMIDAAVDAGHPALRGTDLTYRSFATPGRTPGPAEHGTAIAALLLGRPDAGRGWGGLLPGAHVAAAAIFEVNERGRTVATARALLQAVDWMAGQGVRVVNLSMAGPDNGVIRLATERALQEGLILVAAAGNGASATERAFPAAYPDVIAVTAVSPDGRVYPHANQGPYIDFAAPGVRLWTAVPNGGRFQSGTSFAAPYVTSMAALTLVESPARTVEAVRARLREDVLDLGVRGRDDVFGWGLARMQPACRGNARTAFFAR